MVLHIMEVRLSEPIKVAADNLLRKKKTCQNGSRSAKGFRRDKKSICWFQANEFISTFLQISLSCAVSLVYSTIRAICLHIVNVHSIFPKSMQIILRVCLCYSKCKTTHTVFDHFFVRFALGLDIVVPIGQDVQSRVTILWLTSVSLLLVSVS